MCKVHNLYFFSLVLSVVRPPPGFEAKKPEPQLPMVDDPSIVWSKAIGKLTLVYRLFSLETLVSLPSC